MPFFQDFMIKQHLFVFKSVLPLFRCSTSIERSVKQCQISVSTGSDRVIIQFFCRHGRKWHQWQNVIFHRCACNLYFEHMVALCSKCLCFWVRHNKNLQCAFPGKWGAAGSVCFTPLSQCAESSCQVGISALEPHSSFLQSIHAGCLLVLCFRQNQEYILTKKKPVIS